MLDVPGRLTAVLNWEPGRPLHLFDSSTGTPALKEPLLLQERGDRMLYGSVHQTLFMAAGRRCGFFLYRRWFAHLYTIYIPLEL